MSGYSNKTKWTEGEKHELLLKIMQQLTADQHVKIRVNDLNMPGRSVKSLKHAIEAFNKEIAAFDVPQAPVAAAASAASGSGDAPATTTTRKRAKKDAEDDDDDDDADVDQPAPAKKAKRIVVPKKKNATAIKDVIPALDGADEDDSEDDVKPKPKKRSAKSKSKTAAAKAESGDEDEEI